MTDPAARDADSRPGLAFTTRDELDGRLRFVYRDHDREFDRRVFNDSLVKHLGELYAKIPAWFLLEIPRIFDSAWEYGFSRGHSEGQRDERARTERPA